MVSAALPATIGDVSVAVGDDFVAEVGVHRPPDNYFDVDLIRSLAEAYDALDADPRCRAIVLSAEGKHFCAGADFSGRRESPVDGPTGPASLYVEAVRLFEAATPVVAAVQGAAIGGGLGLACSADFRVASPRARFSANFSRLGFHQGFGLSATLPAIVGQQHTWDLLFTGRRVSGEEAVAIGLADRLAPEESLRETARAFAAEIAGSGPLAVASIRRTMRAGLADRVRAAVDVEAREQMRLRETDDFAEGIRAAAERRPPNFTGA